MSKRTSRINIVGGRGLEPGDSQKYSLSRAALVAEEALDFYAIRGGLNVYFKENSYRILDLFEDRQNCLSVLLVADDVCNKLVEIVLAVVHTECENAPMNFFVGPMRCKTINEVVFNAGWVFDDL